MSRDNSIFNISATIFSIIAFRYRVSEPFWWKLLLELTISEKIFDTGFRLFASSIDIVLTYGFGHDITILQNGNFRLSRLY